MKKERIMGKAATTPVIGNWYHEQIQNFQFEVVAIDSQTDSIEVQFVDGEITDFDQESWQEMAITNCHAPEDSSAGYELSLDDQWNDDRAMIPQNLNNPLNQIEGEMFQGSDEF